MAKSLIGRVLRVAGIGALVVLVLLVGLRLAVPVVGVRIGTRQLSELLGTEVHIGRIELALHRGFLAVQDVRVQQPEGYGRGDLLFVPEVRATVNLGSLFRLPVRIEEMLLADPRVRIVRNRDGSLALDAIIASVLSSSETNDPEEEPAPQDEASLPDYPIFIEVAAVRNLAVSYTDASHPERPHDAELEHLTFVVTNLSLESAAGEDRSTAEEAGSTGTGIGRNRGSLTLRNIRIDHPPGFSGEAFLTVPELTVKAHLPSVFKPEVNLEEVSLKDMAIHLARNASGELNLTAILSKAIPQDTGVSGAAQDIPSDMQGDEAPLDWKVHLKECSIDGLSFLYTDHSLQDEPLEMKVQDLSFTLKDLLSGSGPGMSALATGSRTEEDSEQTGPGAKGSLVLKGVHVDQPSGFSGDALLSWAELRVGFVVHSVLEPSVTLERVEWQAPKVHLAINKDRRVNVEELISGLTPEPPESSQETDPTTATKPSDQGPRIRLSRLSIHDLGFVFSDDSYDSKPFEMRLREMDLESTQLTYDPSGTSDRTLPATLRVTGHRVQEGFADAPVGLYAKMGTLGDEIPALNASLQLAGLELAPMRHVLPPGTEQAIGGDALDLSIDLGLSSQVLDCRAKVKSIGGTTLSLQVGGTPSQPELDRSNALFLVLFRSGGALGSVAGKFGGAGVAVADTAVGTVKEVGTGTVKTLGSVGGGLLHTAKGLATADAGGVAGGLKKTTLGTVKEGAGATVGTLGEVKEGAVDAGSAGIGKTQADAWRKSTRTRWEKAWEKAQARVDQMPYPEP
jgi:hypothetical protein